MFARSQAALAAAHNQGLHVHWHQLSRRCALCPPIGRKCQRAEAESVVRAVLPPRISPLRSVSGPVGAADGGLPLGSAGFTTYRPPDPSDEQLAIVDALLDGRNVKVDAVAGSGKTTAVLLAASRLPSKRLLLLTYNARLKFESRGKAEAMSLINLEVHTFHSMGHQYYSKCATDDDMRRLLEQGRRRRKQFKYDVVIVDEAQDMTPLYCKFVHKVLADNATDGEAQLVVIGDNRQCIYDYLGADERHLVLASSGVFDSSREWQSLALRTSYRSPGNVVSFLNDVCLGFRRLEGVKPPGDPVVYLRGSSFSSARWLAKELCQAIRWGELEPEDIFVLVPSLRQGTSERKTPVIELENMLVEAGIPCFSSASDDEALSEKQIAHKVVFTTYHQSKGLERAAVVCFNFCESYFRYFGHDLDRRFCPNILYVGLTRAKSRLYLVGEDRPGQQLPFLDAGKLKGLIRRDAVRIVESRQYRQNACEEDESESEDTEEEFKHRSFFSVTDLTRHLQDSTVQKAFAYLSAARIQDPQESIQVPHTVPGKDELWEPVSDINGVALPALHEYKSTGHCTIVQHLRERLPETEIARELHHKAVRLWDEEIPRQPTPAMLEIASIWQTSQSGFVARPVQVKDWEYLSEESVQSCMKYLDAHLGGSEIQYEEDLEVHRDQLSVFGRLDAVTDSAVWEIKCVQELTKEHFLQTALYAWMWKQLLQDGNRDDDQPQLEPRFFRLINIRTGELWSIDNEMGVEAAADVIIQARLAMKEPKVSDEEFLARSRESHGFLVAINRSFSRAPPPENALSKGSVAAKSTYSGSIRSQKLPFKCRECRPVRSFKTIEALERHKRNYHLAE